MCDSMKEDAIGPAKYVWDIDEDVKEVRWGRRNDLRCILIPNVWGAHAPYHHPKYEPMWAVCEELGMVLHFHSALLTPGRTSAVTGGTKWEGAIVSSSECSFRDPKHIPLTKC